MALTDKLTNIAEAIRNKTGKTDLMTLAQMPEEIANISSEELINHVDIPDYVKKEVLSLAKKIEQVKQNDSIMFIAMSDMHYYNGQKNTDQYPDQSALQTDIGDLHAAMAAKILAYMYDFDFMAYMGDHIHGNSKTNLDLAQQQGLELKSLLHESHKGIPCFHAIGNHDTNYYYDESQAELGDNSNFLLSGEWLFNNYTKMSDSENTVFGDSTYGGYCYRDFPEKKLRVFLLNTVEYMLYGEEIGSSYYKYCLGTQRKWFADSLIQLNSKTDASEWKFIILSHFPADFGNTMSLSEVIRAYVEGYSISIDLETGSNYSVNFSGKNKARMVAQFHGHIHNFLTSKLHSFKDGYAVQYDAWRIATPNGSYNRENYYDVIGNYPGISFKQPESYGKTIGTGKDTSFVVNIINPSEEVIHSLCYGAGIDRVVGYSKVTYYSIFNILTNVSNSNPSVAIQEGASYSATLTPDELYNFSNVKITMDGIDVTALYYNNGVIDIPKVTGDLSITAVAIRPLASRNQIIYSTDENDNLYHEPYGFVKGYYLSLNETTGAVIEKAKSDQYSTGYIPYTVGQEIRLQNVGFTCDSPNEVYNRIYMFDAQKQYKAFFNAGNEWTLLTKGNGLRNENNEWTYFILTKGSMAGMDEDIAYIRLCAEYIGEDSIITIDEEILYQDQVEGGLEIVKNLTNITSSNTNAKVEYGQAYTTTLVLAENSQITNIKITMGTKDITEQVYDPDTFIITIPRVTGKLTITAKAVIINYTNLVPTATVPPANKGPRGTEIYNAPYGYMNNKRISGMSIVDGAGYVATGVMEWKKLGAFSTLKPIYISGVTLDTSKSYTRFEIIQDNSGVGNTLQAAMEIRDDKAADGRAWATFFDIETLGTDYYKLTPKEVSGVSWYNIRYFMLSLWGNGDNLIITVGEPIGEDNDSNDETGDTTEKVNLLPTAQDVDGTIYNGTGYKANTYLSSSSGNASSSTGKYATGFIQLPEVDPTTIPVGEKGKVVISFDNINVLDNSDVRIALYPEDKTSRYLMKLGTSQFDNVEGNLSSNGNVFEHIDANGNITALDITEMIRYAYYISDGFMPRWFRISFPVELTSSSGIYVN